MVQRPQKLNKWVKRKEKNHHEGAGVMAQWFKPFAALA